MSKTVYQISDLLEEACTNGTTSAVACAVYRNGELMHRSGHGFVSSMPASGSEKERLEENQGLIHRAGPDTWFDIASLTKIMCTTAIAMVMCGRRQLSLESSVEKFLPQFGKSRAERVGMRKQGRRGKIRKGSISEITVEDLLAHRSGLTAWKPFWSEAAIDDIASKVFKSRRERPDGEMLIRAFERSRMITLNEVFSETPEYEPGTIRLYSDTGFIILGAILENIARRPLSVLFRDLVAVPLGLNRTFFVEQATDSFPVPWLCSATRRHVESRGGDMLVGEVDDDNAFALGGVAGHAGLFSTVDDVAGFGEIIRRVYSGENAGYLKPAILHRFLEQPKDTDAYRGVLGFDMPTENSSTGNLMHRQLTIGHLGFTGCSLWVDLSRNLSVALLTNRVHCSEEKEKIYKLRRSLHDEAVRRTE